MSLQKISALMVCFATLALSSSAYADGSSQPYGNGGKRFWEMNPIIQQYNKSGELFRIEGECRSSCTELLSIKNVCIVPSANIEFHAALASRDQDVSPARNREMASHYKPALRAFVAANHYMDSWDFHAVSGAEMISKFGYKQCP